MVDIKADAAGTPPADAITTPPDGKITPPAVDPKTQKAADDAAADLARKADEAKPPSKAPDTYALTVPTGGERFIMAPDLKYIEEVARANGWSNEDAQAEIADAVVRAQAREALQGTAFLEAAKADPEYGGAKFDETQQDAQRVIDRVRPIGHARREKFLAILDRGGVRHEPEILSVMADLGKLMREDQPPRSRAERAGEKTTPEVLYDHPDSQKLAGR